MNTRKIAKTWYEKRRELIVLVVTSYRLILPKVVLIDFEDIFPQEDKGNDMFWSDEPPNKIHFSKLG